MTFRILFSPGTSVKSLFRIYASILRFPLNFFRLVSTCSIFFLSRTQTWKFWIIRKKKKNTPSLVVGIFQIFVSPSAFISLLSLLLTLCQQRTNNFNLNIYYNQEKIQLRSYWMIINTRRGWTNGFCGVIYPMIFYLGNSKGKKKKKKKFPSSSNP